MAHLEVIPATADQESILANLLELYAHDFSEFYPIDLGPDGRFGYGNLPLYWSNTNWHPFLVRLDGMLAGFVLVKQGSEVSGDGAIYDMVEFFVVRGYRRQGIGSDVAADIWRRFPGRWEIRVMEANRGALPFWERSIAGFVGHSVPSVRVQKGDKVWHAFSFESLVASSKHADVPL